MPRAVQPRPESSARARGEAAHQARIFAALERVRADCDAAARRAADPVEFVHRYRARADQELVALLASALAFGNVKALRAKIEDALARIGPSVARAADDPAALRKRLAGWRHRVYVADSSNNRIQVFSSRGRFVRSWGGRGSIDGIMANERRAKASD